MQRPFATEVEGPELRWFGFEAEAGLAEESGDEVRAVLNAGKPVPYGGGELVEGARGEVAQAVLHIRPDAFGRVEVGGVGRHLYDGQPVRVLGDETAHLPADVGVQVVPDHDDRGMQLVMRGGDQGCVVCFGHRAALSLAAPVDAR